VATDNGLTGTSAVVNITITAAVRHNTMRLWLKADSLASQTNNAPVGTWSDSSGAGNDAHSTAIVNLLYVTNGSVIGLAGKRIRFQPKAHRICGEQRRDG